MGEKEDEELWDAINTTKMDEARLKKIKTLLSNGADPNWAPKGVYYTGHNSLHWACFGRRGKPVVDLLLASGINDIDQKTGGDEYTALMLACMNGYAEVAALLNAGADPSLTSKKGETAAQMTAGTYWGAKKVAMIEAEIASPGGALRELQAQQAKEEKKERKAEAKRAEQERKAEAKRAEQARVAAQLQDVTSGDMDAIKTIIKNKKKSPAVYSALMSATSDVRSFYNIHRRCLYPTPPLLLPPFKARASVPFLLKHQPCTTTLDSDASLPTGSFLSLARPYARIYTRTSAPQH